MNTVQPTKWRDVKGTKGTFCSDRRNFRVTGGLIGAVGTDVEGKFIMVFWWP